jgi:CRP-like cAMP-binding protein
MSKPVLQKLTHFQQKDFLRNQEIMKEGTDSKFVFIIRKGEFEVSKLVFKPKDENVPEKGTKKDFELKLVILGPGKMIGDFEAINNVPCQVSVKCLS